MPSTKKEREAADVERHATPLQVSVLRQRVVMQLKPPCTSNLLRRSYEPVRFPSARAAALPSVISSPPVSATRLCKL